jgi:hypothetical protein
MAPGVNFSDEEIESTPGIIFWQAVRVPFFPVKQIVLCEAHLVPFPFNKVRVNPRSR